MQRIPDTFVQLTYEFYFISTSVSTAKYAYCFFQLLTYAMFTLPRERNNLTTF